MNIEEKPSDFPENHDRNVSKPYGYQQHNRPSSSEYLLAIWVFTLLCEEVRQVCNYDEIRFSVIHDYVRLIFSYFQWKLAHLAELL